MPLLQLCSKKSESNVFFAQPVLENLQRVVPVLPRLSLTRVNKDRVLISPRDTLTVGEERAEDI